MGRKTFKYILIILTILLLTSCENTTEISSYKKTGDLALVIEYNEEIGRVLLGGREIENKSEYYLPRGKYLLKYELEGKASLQMEARVGSINRPDSNSRKSEVITRWTKYTLHLLEDSKYKITKDGVFLMGKP